jgi:hypothetical protein
MTDPGWRDGLWRYTAEVGNTMMVIWIGTATFKALAATNSYLTQSEAKLKSVTNKSSSEAMADSLRKALESADTAENLGERVANFTLSTQWTPKGYLCCGSRKRVSFQEGVVYNSRITLRIKYNVFQYGGTLEGKKDKDKEKEKLDYVKLGEAIGRGLRGEQSEEKPEKKDKKKGDIEEVSLLEEPEENVKKDKKVVYNETILQNASIVQGDGKPPQLGWGVKLDITTEIGAGHDGRLYYEFRIYWNESCATASFNDVISIKCYADGSTWASGNFYDACDTADDVLQALSAGGHISNQFTEDEEYLGTERQRAMNANAERLRRRRPQQGVLDDNEVQPLIRHTKRDQYIEIEEGSSSNIIIEDKDKNKTT